MPISLLNGLSQMGSGIAAFAGTAGLELQKAQLANQAQVLADTLATTRETKLQGQQQQFQTGLQAQSQAFQGTQTDKTIAAEAARTAATEGGANTRNAATIAAENERSAAARQAATDLEKLRENAPTETERLFKFLGINPDGSPATTSATPSAPSTGASTTSTDATAAPTTSDAAGAPGATPSAAPGATPSAAPGATPSAVTPVPNAMGNPLARHALGLPQLGSPEDTRYAIAQGVKNDPIFKYKTAAEQAAQVETLFAVATGKMIDPVARTAMAQGIASYQFAPLEGRPLAMPGGAETMKEVLAINPQYQASKYPEISKAMTAFATGPQGNAVRFNNVGVQHLDVLDQAAQNLGNTDVNVANQLKNAFQQQFGSPAPTTFNALKQIVGTEIEKAIAGGIGAAADRDRIMKSLSDANSPEQLINVTNGFRALMVGQLAGLKQQYEEATGFKSGPFAFENKLAPETIAKLQGGGAAHIAPTTNTTSPAGALANAPMGGLYGATTGTTGTAPANPALLKLWGQ